MKRSINLRQKLDGLWLDFDGATCRGSLLVDAMGQDRPGIVGAAVRQAVAQYREEHDILALPPATPRPVTAYIAGPMTGKPALNFPAFHAAAAHYRALGYAVSSPAEINGGDGELAATAVMTEAEYIEHYRRVMRKDIAALIMCDKIIMLDGWTASRGATLEHHIAVTLGMEVLHHAA